MKKQSDKQVKTATENITGIREIKSLGIKKNIEIKLFKNIDEHFKSSNKIRTYEVIYHNLNNLTYFILQFIILITSGYLLIKGKMSYSQFIVIESYIWRIDDIVESISDFGINYTKVVVSLNRINDILKNKLYKDEHFGQKELINPNGTITFKNVEIKYREDEEYTLNNLKLVNYTSKQLKIHTYV